MAVERPPNTKAPGRGASAGPPRRGTSPEDAALIVNSKVFNAEWYRNRYPDVGASGIEPAQHYLTVGLKDWRRPSPDFDPGWYVRQYPDVTRSGLPPILHYLKIGVHEHRYTDGRTFAAAARQARLDAFMASNRTLTLPAAAEPQVSVIVITYNSPHLVFGCLAALSENLKLPSETIVFDNGSGELTRAMLARVAGARVILNAENLHFIRGVNEAAKLAQGRYLLLLNSDAEIEANAVEAAVAAIEELPGAGIVGAQIRLPDGSLQEAGGIVWRDGSCTAYGRGQMPRHPEFLFRREADFFSGAFILIRRDLFAEIGGLDPRYAPAYFEDVDLCFKVKAAGYRAIYEPRAIVTHYEYGSAGSSDAAAELLRRNQVTFRQKWSEALAHKLPPESGNALAARSPVGRSKRLLFVADAALESGFAALRTRQILEAMAGFGVEVSHLPVNLAAGPGDEASPATRRDLPPDTEALGTIGAGDVPAFLERRKQFYGPIVVAGTPAFREIVALRDGRPDLFSQAQLTFACDGIGAPRPKARPDEQGPEGDVELGRRADTVIVTTATDGRAFSDAGCRNVNVVGYAPTSPLTPERLEARRDILFVGRLTEGAGQNVDAVVSFVSEVLPRLGFGVTPPPRLILAGEASAPTIRKLDRLDIIRVGEVPELEPWFARVRLVIAPSEAGGLPFAACEAAAAGVPIVAGPMAAKQLGWRHEQELLVAAGGAAFAAACQRVLEDDTLWRRLRQSAFDAATRDFRFADLNHEVGRFVAG